MYKLTITSYKEFINSSDIEVKTKHAKTLCAPPVRKEHFQYSYIMEKLRFKIGNCDMHPVMEMNQKKKLHLSHVMLKHVTDKSP
jgi:hypothetical protein